MGFNDCNMGRKNWVSNVKKILDEYGFSHMFCNIDSVNTLTFPVIFKRRVIDCYVQEWSSSVERSAVLDEFRIFKDSFVYEDYLD